MGSDNLNYLTFSGGNFWVSLSLDRWQLGPFYRFFRNSITIENSCNSILEDSFAMVVPSSEDYDPPTLRVDYSGFFLADNHEEHDTPCSPHHLSHHRNNTHDSCTVRNLHIMNTPKVHPKNPCPANSVKMVHFDLGRTRSYEQSTSVEYVPSFLRWYKEPEYQEFRNNYRSDCRELARLNEMAGYAGQSILRCFEQCSFEAAMAAATGFMSEEHEEYGLDRSSCLDQTILHNLAIFLADGLSVGLVKMATREIYEQRTERRTLFKRRIIEMSKALAEPSIIRQESEKLSLPATLFAQYVGMATTHSTSFCHEQVMTFVPEVSTTMPALIVV